MKKNIKRKIFYVISIKPINLLLVFLLKIIKILSMNSLSNFINRFPVVGTIKIKSNKNNFYMYSDGGDSIASNLYWGGMNNYEPETMELFNVLLTECKYIFDIGANSGVFSLYCLSTNKNAKVYAFEPVPRNFEYLKKNKEINSYDNLFVYDIALTDFGGKVEFNIPKSISLPLGGSIRNDLEDTMKDSDKVEVKANTIDKFSKENDISSMDLLKIDTEGTEHKVLIGAIESILKYEPIIVCEVLPKLTENFLMEFFKDLKYRFYHITENGLVFKEKIVGDSTFKYHNYLFITDDKMQEYNDKLVIINK